ncbi:MAG: enoyl-CoA hydratase/isomerase family protein [Novosphingobium sp.]
MADDLLVRREGAAGVLSLNRPHALHALTLGMVRAMTEALLAWREEPAVEAVIIDHAPSPDGDPKTSRGFCAGGDIASLREAILVGGAAGGWPFFWHEYRLNHLIFDYPKGVVAFMDGVTMGGGVGISQPAKFRVATENTRFAMPETGIGLHPDVGGGWYLSRLHDRIGQFLALTGARLDGAECLWAGLATHYLPSAALPEAKRRIAADPFHLPQILGELATEPPPARIAANADRIARLFASDRFEEIIAALSADGSDWAAKELATLRTKSPVAQKVALRALAQGHHAASFAENMAMEWRLASRLIGRPDFVEGIRAAIVDKDNAPRWNPATPEEIGDDLLDELFAPLAKGEEWMPLA